MRFLSTTDAPLGAQRSTHRPDGCAKRCSSSPSSAASSARCGAAWRHARSPSPDLPFEIEPALREVDFGEWEGQTLEWVEEHAPELLAQRRRDPVHFRPPDGESIEDASARLRPLAQGLQTGDATLVIGHRVSLGILERLLRDLPLDSPRTSPDSSRLSSGSFARKNGVLRRNDDFVGNERHGIVPNRNRRFGPASKVRRPARARSLGGGLDSSNPSRSFALGR